MKIGILTWGSHGDIRPFLILADGLQQAGHEVHLVITCFNGAEFTDPVSAHGVRITVLRPVSFTPEQGQAIGQMIYSIRNPMRQMSAILRLCFAPAEDAMFAAAQRLCAESEMVIGHYFMHPLQVAAEHAGVPYVSVQLTHAGIPSAYCHPLGDAGLGSLGRRLLWRVTRFALNRAVSAYPNRLRRQLGMPPLRDILTEVWLSRFLTLVAVSPQICQRQPDWDDAIQVSGYLDHPDSGIDGSLPQALEAFLAAGEAPIYMTYGSWMPQDVLGQTQSLHMLTEAARLAQCRAIIQCRDPDQCGLRSSADILYVATAPHAQIFPHCFAVLHHGGAGTTQSATAAGKPSIVVANLSEQEHWGRELQRLGLAAAPLKRRKVSAQVLAQQIRQVRSASQMALRAGAIAQAMRQEDGAAEAVRQIDRRLSQLAAAQQLPA